MPEKPTKVQIPGQSALVDGMEVPVIETTERWTDVKLEDGSALRIKTIVLAAVRLDKQYDPDGNPLYVLKANQLMTVDTAPEHLRKPAPGTPKPH